MAEIKSTSIFKRKKNGKKLPFYYCRFIYDNGTVRTISTKKTTKDTARDYINELIQLESEKNQRLSIEQEKTLIEKQRQELEDEKVRLESLRHLIEKELNIPTVSTYSDYFIYGGKWYTHKQSRGITISKRHCLDRDAMLKNHVLPFFGKYRISEIDAAMIEDYRIYLYQEKHLSGNTINKALTTLSEILTDAVLNKYILSMPLIQRNSDKSKEKGILTPIEKERLFPEDWERVWCREIRKTREGFNKEDIELREKDKIIYAINLFSYDTGCRLGECQAVKVGKIDFNNMTVIIDSAHDNRCRETNNRTKTGIIRELPLTERCMSIINELVKDRKPDDFLFSDTGDKPLEAHAITKGLYKALNRIGINEEQRVKRNLSFHGFRYMYNSDLLEGGAGKEITQKMTGHTTDEMTMKYLKVSEKEIIRSILNNRTKPKLKVIKEATA